jgi:hypothetical protein
MMNMDDGIKNKSRQFGRCNISCRHGREGEDVDVADAQVRGGVSFR